jgi:ABC-type multidrug transport system ATPase subunit
MTWGLRDVTVTYGSRRALSGVSLRLVPAGITAVVGGDGAGKTSALRALVGLARPSSGAVDRPDARRIGYMAAGSGSWPDLTTMENLAFAATAYGLGRSELGPRADTLLDRTGLSEARDRLGGNLSGGMRQKLGLAMSLLHQPELLVLDEPTTGIDPVSRSEIWRLVAGEAARGAAVVFANSYLEEAERAESVLVLDQGQPLAQGSPEEVVEQVPGAVAHADAPATWPLRWRRGAGWRLWSPDGEVPPGARPVRPDLQDAVTVAALARAGREAA